MAPRRRRRKSSLKRLHSFLIEHRFHAAEAFIGVAALSVGLWMLWPGAGFDPEDHRSTWERSLQGTRQVERDAAEGADGDVIAVAEASGEVTAKRHVVGTFGVPSGPSLRPRLAKVAVTMPEIGPPAEPSVATLDPFTARLPANFSAVTAGASPQAQVAGLSAARRDPGGAVPTWVRNAAAMPSLDDRPMVAVVIDDLGMNRRSTASVNELPGPLTLAFLPYAGALDEQAGAARASGHELLLHMPMEPLGTDWPGPNALLSKLGEDEFRQRLRDSFDSFAGFVGINNHMGSRLTTDHERMATVMAELRRRSLLFLDSKTTGASVGAFEAARHGVPFTQRDVFLDNEIELGYIMRQLAKTERLARQRGVAVAIGHPHDVTIEALRRWLPTLERKGLSLVPISSVVARQMCADPTMVLADCRGVPDANPYGAAVAGGAAARQG